MKCSNCSFENSKDSKFCENCGQPFEQACPNCRQPVSANARFCKNCGFNLTSALPSAAKLATLQQATPMPMQEKILSTRKQIEGERKLVTVLFTDIVGSTALAEKLDPEEWGEIVSGAHECVSQAVYRYEGTIAQLLGDGVLAFFGAPITHEDDPVRAVNAGLELLACIANYSRELKTKRRIENFQMRVGVNTGLVVVGNIGTDMHMEYLAVGDTVNLTARLQSAAEPNTLVISENSARLVKYAFDLEFRGTLDLKGKAEPVPAFRVVARKTTPESARGIAGLSSPLVGRDHELRELQARVAELQQGRGQIVSVMGEAGLGKSRLVAESRKFKVGSAKLEDDLATSDFKLFTSHLRWLEGRSLSFETSTPYAPFLNLFNSLFGLVPNDLDAKYSKIKQRVAEIAPGQESEIAPFLAALLGIKIEGEDADKVNYLMPPDLRGRVFNAVLQLFDQLAAREPVILVFEDLHWADSTSLDLIEQLMGLTTRAPLMILALFRPQSQEPSWRIHQTARRSYADRYTSITLEPLDEAESRTLVANLLQIEDLPEKVRLLILRKSEGNPFYVEEVIRSLLDAKLVVYDNGHWRATREIENIAVPDTLSGVITARLDRLDDESKHTAQTAAVIGREFQFGVLADVYQRQGSVEKSLENLEQRELVREKTHAPESIYLFKHALTQETAYASVLLSKRRELHRRVAECLEKRDAARVNDIARHFLEAQEEARALPYLAEAGDRAAHAYATPEAIKYYTRALEILERVNNPELARRAFEGLGSALTLANDIAGALKNYETMLEVAKRQNDIPMQISALNKSSYVIALRLGQFPEAEKRLADAERLAREFRDKPGLSELFTLRCMMCTATADFEGVQQHMGESVDMARASNVKEQIAMGLDHISSSQILMTRFDDAWPTAQEALQLAREVGNREYEASILGSTIPFYHMRMGDLDQAYQIAQQGATIAQTIGATFSQVWGNWVLGEISLLRGEYERAIASYDCALQSSLPLEEAMPFLTVQPLSSLGTAYLSISVKFADRVIEYHQRSLKLLENPAATMGAGTAWVDLGLCALKLGDIDRADEFFQNGLTHPTMFMLLEKPRFLVGSAHVALARHNLDDAAKHVNEARAYVEERQMKYLYPEVALADARVSMARGLGDRALEQFDRAETVALEMKMRPAVLQARAGAATALAQLGRTAEAERKRNAAREMMDEMAGLFRDENLRKVFVESAMNKT